MAAGQDTHPFNYSDIKKLVYLLILFTTKLIAEKKKKKKSKKVKKEKKIKKEKVDAVDKVKIEPHLHQVNCIS